MEKLRIELTEEERADGTVIAFTFARTEEGVWITEHWEDMDELWAAGCTITIPPRIWRLGVEWLDRKNQND